MKMSEANFANFGLIFSTEECKILRPIAIANLAFSTINTILTFTFSSKLSGKYSVGAMIFLTINKGGSGKNTQELNGAIVFHTQQVPNCPAPPSLISNEQSLTQYDRIVHFVIVRQNSLKNWWKMNDKWWFLVWVSEQVSNTRRTLRLASNFFTGFKN